MGIGAGELINSYLLPPCLESVDELRANGREIQHAQSLLHQPWSNVLRKVKVRIHLFRTIGAFYAALYGREAVHL